MSRRKITYEHYRKKKQERTHSVDDILQGFDASMQSPEVPAAIQPQDASRISSYLPPVRKRSKVVDIDPTTEPDIAVEQPLPMAPPSLIPPTPPTTSNSAPGQLTNAGYLVDVLHHARSMLNSSSPSITAQGYTRPIAHDNLSRAPFKSQRQQQQSSSRTHVTGVSSRSKSQQSPSLTSRMAMSFSPSIPSSLPSPPLVGTSPPDKRNTSDNAATITDQSGRAPRKEQLGWVRRSTQQKRSPRPLYGTSSLMVIEDSDSQEEESPVQRRPKTPNVKLLTYKPQGSKMTLDIMSADVECLDPGEYLNDKIIDFYLNYLLYEKLSEEFRSRVHIFSSFFYTRLSNAAMDDEASKCSTPEKIHSRVKTWTRRVDLFLKDYIIIPIYDRAHWYVVIVCHPGLFDPSKVKPPQPRKPKPRARTRKSMRLHKKKQSPKGVSSPSEDINPEEGDKEESSSSQQQQQQEDGRLEIKEGTAEETKVMDVEASILSLPAIAEARSGVSMLLEAAPFTLNLPRKSKPGGRSRKSKDSIGNGELLEEELVVLGEEEGESPFSQLALAGEAGESGGDEEGDVEDEGSATGVGSVEVKEQPLEEEETEPQKWPCIQVLDCLGIKRPTTAKRIRNYLTMEWKSKKCAKEDEMSFEHLPLQYPAIPLLDDSSDCGIFVLQYIESLLETIQGGLPPPSVAEEWASYEKTRTKRKEIKQLIIELQNRDRANQQ